jgi:hypothetical protein
MVCRFNPILNSRPFPRQLEYDGSHKIIYIFANQSWFVDLTLVLTQDPFQDS